jgi:hypothetical protein
VDGYLTGEQMAIKRNAQVYKVKAKIQRDGIEDYWLRVGTAAECEGGKIIITLDALPLHSKGVLMLFPKDAEGEV